MPDSIGVTEHTYSLKEYRGENGEILRVAFHSSVKNPMEKLVKGYRYHRKRRYER